MRKGSMRIECKYKYRIGNRRDKDKDRRIEKREERIKEKR